MASVTNNSKKYGEGHSIILKEAGKVSSPVKNMFDKFGYRVGKSVFSITVNPKNVDNIIQYSTGKDTLFLKDDKSKIIQLIGSPSAIDGTFNHFTKNAKSNTNLLTEIKEDISMWLFQGNFEKNKLLTEDNIISMLGNRKEYFDTTYYQSGVKQLQELKKYIKSGGYTYERQGGALTKPLYTRARKVTNKASDNWNPADVWMIKSRFDMTPLYQAPTAAVLNGLLAEAYYNREVIPISLKNVTTPKASSSVIDPQKMLNMKLDLDLAFSKVDLSETYANFIVQTRAGFAVRVGFKASATTLNVSLEGRMISAGYQLGAVDAKDYTREADQAHSYILRSGVAGGNVLYMDDAKRELKEIFTKYSRISNTIRNYDHAVQLVDGADELTKKRFVNIISYLYSFLIAPTKFEPHMKFCYFSAKKITGLSGLYLILQ
tara:strand:- start:59 stop:1354 length:1296 start_codon:yes stop_codon:yes gene_type:complete